MSGIDFYLQREFPFNVLQQAFANLLDITKDSHRIVITPDSPDEPLPEYCLIWMYVRKTKGEFLQLIEITDHSRYGIDLDRLIVGACSELECTALIPDMSVNPYSYITVDSNGVKTPVLLDGDALDERDEFVLLKRAFNGTGTLPNS